jgi:hypothetical protein
MEARRIVGAVRFGRGCMTPKDAVKPEDGRKNNRRQPKKKPAGHH